MNHRTPKVGKISGEYWTIQHDYYGDGKWSFSSFDCAPRAVYSRGHKEGWQKHGNCGFETEAAAIEALQLWRQFEYLDGPYHERKSSWQGRPMRVVKVTYSTEVEVVATFGPFKAGVPDSRPVRK